MLFARSFFLSLMLSHGAAFAADAPPESRQASEAERKAFFDFYRQARPDNHGEQPRLTVIRKDSAARWEITAEVDSQPARGLRTLCRSQRASYRLAQRWLALGAPREMAWIDRAACRAPARPVTLLHPMPDAEVLALLEQAPTLLKSARLLFGGNTMCARQRAYPFSLAAIDIGTSGSSTEVLAGLQFHSDRATRATVWVRRNGLSYDAWNVSCS